jgi:DNA topoisomerase-3
MELYIAEKPSVGKAIAENLGGAMRSVRGQKGPTHIIVGDDKIVTWCFGHILEMAEPESYDASFANWTASASKLPFIPEKWIQEPVPTAREQLNVIEELLSQASVVIHAGDPDREGQLLVDEVLHYLNNRLPVKRILPNAMDAASMKKILADRRENSDFLGLYESALGRQRADQMVGVNFTRACTISNQRSGMRGVLSVGRVQTPTLAMVVRRDLEIENFKPQNYFDIVAQFKHANGIYTAKWKPSKTQKGIDSEGRLTDEAVANALSAAISGKAGQIAEYKVEDGSQRAPLPFSLTTLQSKASSMFGMSAQEVLDICQSLYEVHKVATYPRTDCQYLPESQHADAPGVLKAISNFDSSMSGLVGGSNNKIRSQVWNDGKVTAHHGIVPTSNANYGSLTPSERKIFGLICKFYVAQFYPDFTFKKTSVQTECSGQMFNASGRTPVNMGWRKVFGADDIKEEDAKGNNVAEDDGQMLPSMSTGDKVVCDKLSKDKKQTKPPAYYTEGTLIRAMSNVHETVEDPELKKKLKEVKGIGTVATQASMIEKLKKREFLELKAGKIKSTSAGREFIAALPQELANPAMTAMWENLLDKVEERVLPLSKFTEGQGQFVAKMTKRLLESKISIAAGVKNKAVVDAAKLGAGAPCPSCGKGTMGLRQAKNGDNAGNYFLGCSNFPNCKNTSEIAGQKSGSGASKGASKSPSKSAAPSPYASRSGGGSGTRGKSGGGGTGRGSKG